MEKKHKMQESVLKSPKLLRIISILLLFFIVFTSFVFVY